MFETLVMFIVLQKKFFLTNKNIVQHLNINIVQQEALTLDLIEDIPNNGQKLISNLLMGKTW